MMTGKQLSDDHRAILAKLLQIKKLNNHEIAWVLDVDERTVRRRRYEFEATGEVKKHKDVSKNAEKLKAHHLEVASLSCHTLLWFSAALTQLVRAFQKLVEWHKDHPDALLDDMQLFLRMQCGLEVSLPTVSRQLRKAYGGTFLRNGRCARIRSRKQREAEGRSIALELQQNVGDDGGAKPSDTEMYRDQRQLVSLERLSAPQLETPRSEQGMVYPAGGGQQLPGDSAS